jgi:hypothetical protein
VGPQQQNNTDFHIYDDVQSICVTIVFSSSIHDDMYNFVINHLSLVPKIEIVITKTSWMCTFLVVVGFLSSPRVCIAPSCDYGGMSIDFFSSLTVCGAPAVTAG